MVSIPRIGITEWNRFQWIPCVYSIAYVKFFVNTFPQKKQTVNIFLRFWNFKRFRFGAFRQSAQPIDANSTIFRLNSVNPSKKHVLNIRNV